MIRQVQQYKHLERQYEMTFKKSKKWVSDEDEVRQD